MREVAYFAGGCFWGVEYFFKKARGVVSTRVGYMGGHKAKPTYEEVCSGTTGHLETVEVTYDSEETSFEELAKLFFEIHDPTQINRQGPDIGEQYQSAIFYVDENQRKIAQDLISELEGKGYKVSTQLREAGVFWVAEEYHQNYYGKTGKEPYCHFRIERFK
ncbi:MAG: peptide-methionine (S)-S-oxide reductase MsrA [Thermoproteota archaeon]